MAAWQLIVSLVVRIKRPIKAYKRQTIQMHPPKRSLHLLRIIIRGPRANSIPLSDKEIDQLLDKYNYKKVNDYTTVIEKKEGMALTFTYIWAKSKSGNKIRFPDTFKAIVQRINGNYYAVFSDGTMDSIQNDFFENFSDNDYKRCTTKYACDEPGGPYSYVYEMTNRKPIGE